MHSLNCFSTECVLDVIVRTSALQQHNCSFCCVHLSYKFMIALFTSWPLANNDCFDGDTRDRCWDVPSSPVS